jgi:hypothetical protein
MVSFWEDIYDNLLADSRKSETTVPLEEFEAELRAEGLLIGEAILD